MRNKNFLLFIITFILFIVVTKYEIPSLILSNTSENRYSSTTVSDSKETSPAIREFEVKEESLMKFKIAAVTGDSNLKVELVCEDTGKRYLDLYGKNLTHAVFKKLEPGNYTFQITSFEAPTAYSYRLDVSTPKNR